MAGETVVCEVLAGRLGSALNPIVEILDSEGRPMPVEEVTVGTDPVLAFRVETTGEYVLLVSNLSFHGTPKHVYRINLSTSPYAIAAFPAGGRAGDRREVTFYTLSGTGVPNAMKDTVTFAESHLGDGDGDFFYRTWRPHTNSLNPVQLVTGTLPEVLGDDEASSESPMKLTLPVTVNGQFLNASDDDWYAFEAQEGQAYSVVCRAVPSGPVSYTHLTLPTRDLV